MGNSKAFRTPSIKVTFFFVLVLNGLLDVKAQGEELENFNMPKDSVTLEAFSCLKYNWCTINGHIDF